MTEHEEHEWIPPDDKDQLGLFGSPVQDTPREPPPDHSWLRSAHVGLKPEKLVTPAVERFAEFATGVLMYSLLGVTVILLLGLAARLIRWAFGG